MHRTRNAAYGQPYRGFESLPLRQLVARFEPRQRLRPQISIFHAKLAFFLGTNRSARLRMRGGQRLAGRYSLQDLNPLRFSNLRNRQAHNLKGRRFESYSRNNFNFAKYSPRLLAPSKGLGIAVFSEPPKCPDGVAGALFVL